MDPKLLMNAALRKREETLSSTVTTDDNSLSSLVPALVQDAYSFIDLIYSIRNPAFNVPRFTTLGRYRYLIQLQCQRYKSSLVAYASPLVDTDDRDRRHILADIDWEVIEPLDNLLICDISNTSQEIEALPLGPPSLRFTDKIWCVPHRSGKWFSLTFRIVTLNAVSTQADRLTALRMKASNSPTAPPRTVLMLGDPIFPLECIPGCSNLSMLAVLCREDDGQARFYE